MTMADQALTGFFDNLDPRQLPLPVHTAVAARTAALLQAGPPTAAALAALAGTDPVLAGSLFRAANATGYTGLPRVGSLAAAIRRLGSEAAGQVAVIACRDGQRANRGPLTARYLTPLWQHSLGCAVGAHWLARRCGYPGLAETAHLAGLFHDCGKYLLLAGFAQRTGDGHADTPLGDQFVAEVLAALHVEFGSRLAIWWHLPEDIARVAGRHHEAGVDPRDLLLALVKLANQGCGKVGLGWERNPDLVLPTTAEAQFLGIDEIALAEFEIMLEDHFQLVPTAASGAA
jgi:HD-like signal output (HDOD) protein